jgi:hypothetical protein
MMVLGVDEHDVIRLNVGGRLFTVQRWVSALDLIVIIAILIAAAASSRVLT